MNGWVMPSADAVALLKRLGKYADDVPGWVGSGLERQPLVP